MHKLVKQNLTVFEKQKIENILTKIFVLFLCFIFSWEQTLRFRFENFLINLKYKDFRIDYIKIKHLKCVISGVKIRKYSFKNSSLNQFLRFKVFFNLSFITVFFYHLNTY